MKRGPPGEWDNKSGYPPPPYKQQQVRRETYDG
jgi:hypothetical protein